MPLSATLCTGVTFAAVAGLMFFGGIGIHFGMPALVRSQVDSQVAIKDDSSPFYQAWVDHGGAGCPIYQYFYILNCTNADRFITHGEKPKLEQVGPYAYRMFNWKEDVKFTEDKTEVDFTYHNYYVHVPERDGPGVSLDDVVTVPNFALQGALLMAKQMGVLPYVKKLIQQRMAASCADPNADTCETLFLRRKVSEVLWGFNDPILSMIAEVDPKLLPPGVTPFIGLQSIDTPSFYQNGNRQYTGVGDYKRSYVFTKWAGVTNLSQWWLPGAKGYDGFGTATDGWQFRPRPPPELDVMVDALNIVASFHYVKKSAYKGMTTHQYEFIPETWQVGSDFGQTHYNYAPCDGLLNLTSVRSASIFISKPYYLDAQPCLADSVEFPGKPNRDDHDTRIEVEPTTGNAVAAWQRVQINLQMDSWLCELAGKPGPVPENCNIENTFVPIVWLDQVSVAPQNMADELKQQVFGLQDTMNIAAYVGIGLAFGVAAWAVLLIWQHKRHRMELSLLREQDDEDAQTQFSKQDQFDAGLYAKSPSQARSNKSLKKQAIEP
eukprot:TRINITY_DN2723_c5_g1_i1.p1 TRINITY_DN2723_c5_g1~~TRINITY_DN2723_c5_g1_i1.p1  ORF type:complete len:549 (+),score=209.42 TRINITY_DN2723_c5_g1_i1:99-1745(+)